MAFLQMMEMNNSIRLSAFALGFRSTPGGGEELEYKFVSIQAEVWHTLSILSKRSTEARVRSVLIFLQIKPLRSRRSSTQVRNKVPLSHI